MLLIYHLISFVFKENTINIEKKCQYENFNYASPRIELQNL